MRIEPIDLRNAGEREYAATSAFLNQIRLEQLPDDPPIPLDEDIRRWQTIPAFVNVFAWSAWSDDRREVVAEARVSFLNAPQNRHVVDFGINVRKDLRRRGIGTQLLARIAGVTEREGRRLMITFTFGTIPEGESFLRRLGARVGLETHTNQLDMRDLSRDLIRQWIDRAKEHAADFDLLVWTDGVPETYLERFAGLLDAMNRAPRGNLEVEDMHWTPEQLRQRDLADRGRGTQHWIMVALDRATGNLAGLTEVMWHPNRPDLLNQGDTAVLSAYQNRGLGRWLKAAMLDKVLRDRPQVKKIRTGNADANAPMLKINYALGFKPYQPHYVWQVRLEQVQPYLDSAREIGGLGVRAF